MHESADPTSADSLTRSADLVHRDPSRPDPGVELAPFLARCTFASRGTAVTCALSGGPDSTALVALAVAADLDVTAVHVDHGLRADSGDDADIAAATARHFSVAFRSERIELDDGPNLEARARRARRDVVGPGALTGHTADDQAETLLLSLLRGAGSTGLGAMRPGPTKPILSLRRVETHEICAGLGLSVATDPSNSDPRFRRNRVRNEIIPLLDDVADRDVTALLGRTSSLLRADDAFLDDLSQAIDPTDALTLGAAAEPIARRAIRRWVIDAMTGDPATATLGSPADDATGNTTGAERHPPDMATVERILAVARGEAAGCDLTSGWRVERSRQRLRLFSTRDTSE